MIGGRRSRCRRGRVGQPVRSVRRRAGISRGGRDEEPRASGPDATAAAGRRTAGAWTSASPHLDALAGTVNRRSRRARRGTPRPGRRAWRGGSRPPGRRTAGSAERAEQPAGRAVAVGGDLQRALRVVGRGVHAERDDQRVGAGRDPLGQRRRTASSHAVVAGARRSGRLRVAPAPAPAPVSSAYPTKCGNQPAPGSTCTEP